jgi:hypothetical protein
MIHFVYRAPRYSSFLGKLSEKLAFSIGLPKGIPALWRNGKYLPWRTPVRAPHSISFNLLKALGKLDTVKFYDLYEKTVCNMKSGDSLLCVPVQAYDGKQWNDPAVYRVTARTLEAYKDRTDIAKFVIMPYTHDPLYNRTTEELIRRHGKNLIIVSGKYWTDSWDRSPIKGYVENLLRVNMGIDASEYPVVKTRFNPKGKRRYLYVGHTGFYKNTAELERIAAAIPGFEGGHIGGGTIKGWTKLADFADLTPEFMAKIAKDYDIFLNTSTADASPTTILEQMCFGFAVACTPESSYDYESLTMLSTDDTALNVRALEELQQLDEEELLARAKRNRRYAIDFHNWDGICGKIAAFIASKPKPEDRLFLVD